MSPLLLFAFGAGMVATVNPCGFAMLPAYLSLFLTDPNGPAPRGSGVGRGMKVGAAITAAFVGVFGAAGWVVTTVSQGVVRAAPWAAIVVGLGLVGAGIGVIRGARISIPALDLRPGGGRTVGAMAVFGVAYAVASLSCTLPIFLAVATQALTAPSVLAGSGIFVAYGLGMGIVLTALAVALGTSRDALLRRARRLAPRMEQVGGWLLVASGAYVVYYWAVLLFVPGSGGPLSRPISAINRLSGWFMGVLGAAPELWAGVLILVVLVMAAFEGRRRRAEGRERGTGDTVGDPPRRDRR